MKYCFFFFFPSQCLHPARSFETGRKDLCSETSLRGLEPKLNWSRLLRFITVRSRQQKKRVAHPSRFVQSYTHIHTHTVNWHSGTEGVSPSTLLLWAGCQRCPPSKNTQTHTLMHTHINPWLSLGPVLGLPD